MDGCASHRESGHSMNPHGTTNHPLGTRGRVLDLVAQQAFWQQSQHHEMHAPFDMNLPAHGYSTAEIAAVHGLASAVDEYKRVCDLARHDGRCTLEAMLLADVSLVIEGQWQQELGEGTVEDLHRKLIDVAATAVHWARTLEEAAPQGTRR